MSGAALSGCIVFVLLRLFSSLGTVAKIHHPRECFSAVLAENSAVLVENSAVLAKNREKP